MKRSRAISQVRRASIIMALLLVTLLWSACVTSIVPPHSPPNPTTVWIIDYGRHASLVIPNNGTAVEYEYGEWQWFALGQTQSPRVVPVLFWPTQGTLGRRHRPHLPDEARLKSEASVEHVFRITVSSNAVARLRQNLQTRYEANVQSELFNQDYQMTFVKDPADYTALHNCNHELASWLKDLGCTIRGRAIFARFRLVCDDQ